MESREVRLTMQDIADLAQVQRSVVSMWRKRPTMGPDRVAFPAGRTDATGRETFDRDEVVAYLTRTGRGNNDQLAIDALAAAPPTNGDVDALQALIGLHALTGAEFSVLTPEEREALALAEDPSDRMFLSEVRGSDDALVAYADELIAASLGPQDAWARVQKGPLVRARAERGFDPELGDLVAAVVNACRETESDLDPVLAPTAGFDLGVLAAGFTGLVIPGDDWDPAVRRLRRLIRIHELEEVAPEPPTVRVAVLLGSPNDELLDRLDDLRLDLGPNDHTVVVGPASLLCDSMNRPAQAARAETLRDGNLVMAIRLPRGLWKEAHRQNLALWVLSGSAGYEQVRMADLTEETRIPEELAADVVAALAGSEGHRSYRYARSGALSTILAGGPVVPRGVRAVAWGHGPDDGHLSQALAASLVTSERLEAFDVDVVAAPGSVTHRTRSIAELQDLGFVQVIRGSRIDRSHAANDGTVAVLTASGTYDDVRLDPFDVQRLYPRARRTEPGDVIFEQQPPRAVVDVVGGSLVATPARILRLAQHAPVGPHLLAHAINSATHAEWETWAVAEIPRDDRIAIERVASEAAHYRAVLVNRLDALDRLVASVVAGVAAGSVALPEPRGTTPGATPTEESGIA